MSPRQTGIIRSLRLKCGLCNCDGNNFCNHFGRDEKGRRRPQGIFCDKCKRVFSKEQVDQFEQEFNKLVADSTRKYHSGPIRKIFWTVVDSVYNFIFYKLPSLWQK